MSDIHLYIIKRDNPNAKALDELGLKSKQIFDGTKKLLKEWGAETFRESSNFFIAFGGLTCVGFKGGTPPDPENWKPAGARFEKHEFVPRKSTAVGKARAKVMAQMEEDAVTKDALCAALGYSHDFGKCPGFAQSDEYIGFQVKGHWGAVIPEGAEEVTVTRYNEVLKAKP